MYVKQVFNYYSKAEDKHYRYAMYFRKDVLNTFTPKDISSEFDKIYNIRFADIVVENNLVIKSRESIEYLLDSFLDKDFTQRV